MLNCWVTETNEALMRVENIDDLGEVGQRTRQAIDLVDDDDIDPSGFDVAHELRQARALHAAAREAAIVVCLGRAFQPSCFWLAM